MFTLSAQLLTIQQIFIDSFGIFRSLFKSVFWFSLFYAALLLAPNFFIEELNIRDPIRFLNFVDQNLVFIIFYLLFVIWGHIIMLSRIARFMAKAPMPFLDSVKFALTKLPLVAAACLITGLVVLVGYAAFLVPGIFLTVSLGFYVPILLFDNTHLLAAFDASCKLVWQHWWRTAIIFLLTSAIFFILAGLTSFIESIGIIKRSGSFDVWAFHHVMRILITTLFFPFSNIVLLRQFQDLKQRKPEVMTDLQTAHLRSTTKQNTLDRQSN